MFCSVLFIELNNQRYHTTPIHVQFRYLNYFKTLADPPFKRFQGSLFASRAKSQLFICSLRAFLVKISHQS